jgi:hypothetical protein
MAIEIKRFCPLGHKACEYAEDGYIYRCNWYEQLRGKHPQSEEIIDEWKCSVSWIPTLMTEMTQTNRGQTQALESFRNETLKLATTPPTIKRIDHGK